LKILVSQKRPSNKQQLIEAIIACWHHVITVLEMENTVNLMPIHIKAVIAANGYATND
jgi:hypothetical protein